MNRFKNVSLVMLLSLTLLLCSCAANTAPSQTPSQTTKPAASAESAPSQNTQPMASAESAPSQTLDVSSVPQNGNTIVSLSPSITETLIDLGLGGSIIGFDLQSEGIEGLDPNAEKFDMVSPDLERLLSLSPDTVIVSEMSLYDAQDPFKPLSDAGIKVISVPTPQNIAEIRDYITSTAQALGVAEKGAELLSDFDSKLAEIGKIAEQIPEDERKSVYFEISAAPEMYSFGTDTYLNEIVELTGAENILADTPGFMPVNDEAVTSADPDVILTNVAYIENPVGEILGRDGFKDVTAVKNNAVFQVNADYSSRPNENVTKAALEVAKAVYPDYYADL